VVIAHILSSLGIGGQERVALDLARGQLLRGHQTIAIALAQPPSGPPHDLIASEFREGGVEVVTCAKRGGFDATLALRLALVLRRRGVTLAHTHNPLALIYGVAAAELARTRVVHTKHGANPMPARRLWLVRAAGARTRAYVAVSSAAAQVARERREAPLRRICVIRNGIDLARFEPSSSRREAVRRELGLPAAAWVVGTVARLAPEKDVATLVRAAAPLLGPQHRLAIVGDGAERAALAGMVSSLGLTPFVHFLGARRDIWRLLPALDVFALTSRSEGQPLVLSEAMATGLPIVATRVGGVPQVVPPDVGVLAPPGDAPAVGRALASLEKDRLLGENYGKRARIVAMERDSATRMLDEYMALYEQVLA
jgi:glycosyltransferase involved in cell wall biosynthesis